MALRPHKSHFWSFILRKQSGVWSRLLMFISVLFITAKNWGKTQSGSMDSLTLIIKNIYPTHFIPELNMNSKRKIYTNLTYKNRYKTINIRNWSFFRTKPQNNDYVRFSAGMQVWFRKRKSVNAQYAVLKKNSDQLDGYRKSFL